MSKVASAFQQPRVETLAEHIDDKGKLDTRAVERIKISDQKAWNKQLSQIIQNQTQRINAANSNREMWVGICKTLIVVTGLISIPFVITLSPWFLMLIPAAFVAAGICYLCNSGGFADGMHETKKQAEHAQKLVKSSDFQRFARKHKIRHLKVSFDQLRMFHGIYENRHHIRKESSKSLPKLIGKIRDMVKDCRSTVKDCRTIVRDCKDRADKCTTLLHSIIEQRRQMQRV